jgi:hypothetical protein
MLRAIRMLLRPYCANTMTAAKVLYALHSRTTTNREILSRKSPDVFKYAQSFWYVCQARALSALTACCPRTSAVTHS